MKNKQNSKGLVPRLRFPGFQGEWGLKLLGDVSERIVEKVGNKSLTPVSITAGRGFVSQVEKFGRDISGKQYKNYIRLRRGDFSYNKGNSKSFPQGCVCRLKEFDEVAAPNAFISFHLHESYIPEFIEALFEKNIHGLQLKKFITSSARSDGLLNVSAKEFFSLNLPIPREIAEQQRIADCLSSLDDLIAAEGRKLEALRAHKKGLMQQLFPREGETVPRLRFPGFEGEWKKCTIGDVASLKNGYAFKSSTYVEKGDYRIVTISNVQSGWLNLETTKYLKKIPTDIQRHQILKIEDILISMTGNVGRVCRVTEVNLLLNQRVGKIIPQNIHNSFLYQLLLKDEFRKSMEMNAEGGA
ncbi:MAG: restriction endonuclease subunit S, partial [Anaerolineales bacterium]